MISPAHFTHALKMEVKISYETLSLYKNGVTSLETPNILENVFSATHSIHTLKMEAKTS
jgi:hypothetical protein